LPNSSGWRAPTPSIVMRTSALSSSQRQPHHPT